VNLLIILVVLFGALALAVWALEGRAKPLSPEKANKLSRWVMILVGISLVLSMFRYL